MNTNFVQDEFDQPLNEKFVPTPARRWSLTTLMAARPNPQHDTRATAIQWNTRYKGVEQLQVNVADFPVEQPEITKEQTEESYARLRRLSNEKPQLKVVEE